MSTRTVAVGAVALIVVAGLGYMAYAAAQKKSQQRHVKEVVVDTTGKLRQVLAAKTAPDLVAPLDENLKSAKAPRDPKLADAAEHYILGAREIARRRAQIDGLAQKYAASRHGLASHMAHASHRGTGWMDQAIALKKKMENDHFNLSLELKTLDGLIATLPDAEERLAPLVGQDVLVEETLRVSARKQVQEELRRANDELEASRRLNLR
jgi:hypothetical protein